MPIPLEQIGAARFRAAPGGIAESKSMARFFEEQVAFLSHSHKDKDYAKGLQVLLREHGWRVYLDWEDGGMPEVPSRATGAAVQQRIAESDCLLYLATPNSALSRWCPWEIGVADKTKGIERVLIIPTTDRSGLHHGQEYLQLYRQITVGASGRLAAFAPGAKQGTLLEALTV